MGSGFTIPDWKAQSEITVSQALPSLGEHSSERVNLLLLLLCFFQSSPLTLDLLWRGGTRQTRWNEQGEKEALAAYEIGLDHDLIRILSDYQELEQSIRKLEIAQVIRRVSLFDTPAFLLDRPISTRVIEGLSNDLMSFWMQQALLIASHCFPRKYLELEYVPHLCLLALILTYHRYRQMARRFFPHLQHTLNEFLDRESLQSLSDNAKADLVLSLIEASRLPGAERKHYAISQAKKLLQYSKDSYLHACVAQRECLISRVSGDSNQSTLTLSSFWTQFNSFEHTINQRVNAELGQLTLQSAISHIQNEELTKAIEALQTWQPLKPDSPSTMERVTLYHLNLKQGLAFRYQGAFSSSQACLHKAMLEVERDNLEDARASTTCNLADVYCELEDFVSAEKLLDAEIDHIESRGMKDTSDWYLLQISRAEVLLGQRQLDRAKPLCLEIQSYPCLSKFSNLRLSTLLARIYQVKRDWISARHYWTVALSRISAYPLVNGNSTKMILYSMKEVLRHGGDRKWSDEYGAQIKKLEEIKPERCEYWIPGLGRWYHQLTKNSAKL